MRAAWLLVAFVVAACTVESSPDPEIRVVDLNAAMGYRAGRGDPKGTDPTTRDLNLLADDLLGQRADVANLQEMALPAAEHLSRILTSRTGDEWQLNFCWAGTATYYPGKNSREGPARGYVDVPTGNAQLIRLGEGITAQRPITVDNVHDDQGIVLPSGGRAFQGTEITTTAGVVDVFTTHLALERQLPDETRAADIDRLRQTTESKPAPTVVTGDFNQFVDEPNPSPLTSAAVRAFTERHGYTDVARDLGPTSNQKGTYEGTHRIDYILTRGVTTTDTTRFTSHESDHWGLATTLVTTTG